MAWKTLETEYLIREPWLTARRDKVELPTGVVLNDYYETSAKPTILSTLTHTLLEE